MGSRLIKALSATLMVVVLLTSPLGATASAQTGSPGDSYVTERPLPVICTNIPAPTLTIEGNELIVTYPEIYLQCVTNLLIEADGVVLYDGPPSATLVLRIDISGVQPGTTITVTATTLEGVQVTASITLDDSGVNPSVPAGTGAIPIGDATGGDRFAITGSNVNTPIAIGAALLGAGGLALMAARRRERSVAPA